MVAAPRYGTATFIGQSGVTYIKDVYVSDVAAALVNWDSGGGAGTGSETFWTMPENGLLVDVSLASGLTDTTKVQLTRNGNPTGDMLRYANHLNTLSERPKLRIPIGAMQRVGMIQLA